MVEATTEHLKVPREDIKKQQQKKFAIHIQPNTLLTPDETPLELLEANEKMFDPTVHELNPKRSAKTLHPEGENKSLWSIDEIETPVIHHPDNLLLNMTLESVTEVAVTKLKEGEESLSTFDSWDTANKYKVVMALENDTFINGGAAEKSTSTNSLVVNRKKPFQIDIYTQDVKASSAPSKLLSIKRNYNSSLGEGFIYGPNRVKPEKKGNKLGYMKKKFALLYNIYEVYDINTNLHFTITGSSISSTWNIMKNNVQVGTIQRRYMGMFQEPKNTFKIDFPVDASPMEKALLIGTAFMIEYEAFDAPK